MTSPDVTARDDQVGQLRAMRDLFGYGFKAERRLMITAIGLAALASLPQTLMIYWTGLFINGLADRDESTIALAAGALGASLCVGWILKLVSGRVTKRFQGRMSAVFETRIALLQSQIPTLEHHERSSVLDRLAVLRNETYVLDHMYSTVLQAVMWLSRIISVLILLTAVSPLSLILLVALVPIAVVSIVRPLRERHAEGQAAASKRLADHLHRVLTSSEASKEIRVLDLGSPLTQRRQKEWIAWHRTIARSRNMTALSTTAAWSVFFVCMVVVIGLSAGAEATAGDAVILLLGGQQLGSFVSTLLSEVGYIRGTWMEGAERMAWLEAYAKSARHHGHLQPPRLEANGIQARDLAFTYPGSTKPAVTGVNLDIPPGSVVAVVGENGAGKSTLVKLLAGFYVADSGRLTVGGVELSQVDVEAWRKHLSGCFQDFSRFELPLRESIGLGDPDHLADDAAVLTAARRGGAASLVARLPRGLDTQLGHRWPDGVDLSGGEWQKVALSRCFMRGSPMIRFLDEPTSALDAETEHELFARYADAADDSVTTILVSHRFSTVSMADHILVMDGARVIEQGSHEELMNQRGTYSELYTTQAEAYLRGSDRP
ncbi:ABC transporter ATP-binding protein [Kribbella sp. DT2]|uniref:ABC transporter ATP-binding protein n=1 Tax=Kribbella sp. DT2 TaxID=3393427 RepID=UPI003CE9CC36